MKKKFSCSCSALAVFAALTSLFAVRAEALSVTNGDFSDLTGLTEQQWGWYQGVPAGWTSTAVNPAFAVQVETAGSPPPIANLNTLSTLRQNVGTNPVPSLVTVTFDLEAFDGDPTTTVRITDGSSVVYGAGSYPTGDGQTLEAYTPADVPIYIEFSSAQQAGLDNVSVSSVPDEPSLSLTNGDFADLGGLTEIGEGWYAGVPEGWTTTAASESGHEYSLRQVAGTFFANLDVLGNVRDGFNPLRQSLGVVDVDSNITVSFKTASLNGNPYAVGSAIFDAFDDTPLAVFAAPAPVNGVTTVTYSAYGIPAGTEVYIAFWSTLPTYSPGITDVDVSLGTAESTVTLESGAVLTLEAETPVTTASNIVFQPGTTVSLSGTPASPEVALLSSLGSISGAPVLDPSVAGYALANTGNLLWLRPADGSLLAVFNGDFNNLSGLAVAYEAPTGEIWYSGVPQGWLYTNPANNAVFTVYETIPGDAAANLSVLGDGYAGFSPLIQNVGTMERAGNITVTFDVLKLNGEEPVSVGAAIYNAADNSLLANVSVDGTSGPDTGTFSVTANNVAAGTPIKIALWSGLNPPAYPFLDNVTISTSSFEPALVNGDFADLGGLTDLGEGWYAGVPDGWSTTAPTDNGYAYSVLQLADGYYANLDVLGNVRDGFHPLRQNLGEVTTDSDITVTFKTASLDGNPYAVGSAIFDASDDTPLAVFTTPAPVNGVTTMTYSARGIPAGTEVYVAFWSTLPSYSPGITDVTVSNSAAADTIVFASGSFLQIDPSLPVSTDANLEFAAGAGIKVVGASAPSGSALRLLSTSGAISGAPQLDPAVPGYELVGTSNLLWLRKGLALYNGNFQDLTGLAANAADGWYDGIPAGWSSSTPFLTFNVINWNSGDFAASIQTLGPASPFNPLYQTGGLSDSTGIVRLTFNILGFSETYGMAAAIYEATPGGSLATWNVLATATYDETSGSLQTLEALNVPAGTPIVVAFWSWSGSPGIDNVILSADAPSDLSYSPDSVSAAIGVAITPLGPPSVNGTVTSYSISPALPTGLVIDASTGVISGTPTAASASTVYTVTASNAGGSTTAEVTIDVAGNAYNTWAAGYSLDPATDGAPGADPDGDGFLNSSEFAFGTNPTVGNPALVRTSTAGGQFVMSWMQRIDSPSAYAVQESANLATGPWTASPATVQPGTGPTPPAGYEWKQISVTPTGKKFYRVTASL